MVTRRHQIDLEAAVMISIVAVISMFLVWHTNQNNQQKFRVSLNTNNSSINLVPPTATPSPTAVPVPIIDISSQISPDGTKKLIMKTTHNADGTLIYKFSVTDETGNTENPVYTETLSGSDTFSIPFNSWSPDNKYFFILKNNTEAMVFNASGEPYAGGESYLDVTSLFKQSNTVNTIREVTGWAGYGLLVVNTYAENGEIGPSYWFEVPGKDIIVLGTLFD